MAEQERLVRVFSRAQIQAKVRTLARAIRQDYQGRELVVIGVLKGAFIFLADLIRALRLPLTLHFVSVSSYGARTESSGAATINAPHTLSVEGQDVLVVEAILDTGLSMKVLLEYLQARSPRSVRVCALIDKRERRTEPIRADYVGFVLTAGFIVGYGIDYAEKYRYLSEIYRVELESAAPSGIAPTSLGERSE